MKKEFNKKLKGFTLIELLVVITIIGILATIVVVNLNSARGKGQDTAIKEQMSQIRAQASLYYDDHYGYSSTNTQSDVAGGTCVTTTGAVGTAGAATNFFSDSDFLRSALAIYKNAGAIPTCYLSASVGSNAPSQSWAMTAKLKLPSSTGGLWCVDSYGSAKEVTSAPAKDSAGEYKCQ